VVSETLPAQSLDAERAVLGAMLLDNRALKLMSDKLGADDFYQPQHQVIFTRICFMAREGVPVDPITAAKALGENGEIGRVGGAVYLHTLINECPSAANCGYYASIVQDAAKCRRVREAGDRLIQLASTYEASGLGSVDAMMERVAGEALALSMLLDLNTDTSPIEGLSTWDDFWVSEPETQVWRIPGCLAIQDVMMILSLPGYGKSVLSRQVAIALAGGRHPFRDEACPPMRTLLIDLENPPTTVAIQSRPIGTQVKSMGDWAEDRGWVWRKPGGLNLRKREDAQLFERVINETQPDVVCLGSLYKAYQRGHDDWDTAADETREVFDKMRERYRIALWLEHHMPRGQAGIGSGNPFGSTIWERWPGFGRMLDKIDDNNYELKITFRGDRDERDFPLGLHRGGVLPWTPIYDRAELEYLRTAAAKAAKL
jgi:replicative DNA helicase